MTAFLNHSEHDATPSNIALQHQARRHRANRSATVPSTGPHCQLKRHGANHSVTAPNTVSRHQTQRRSSKHGGTVPNTSPKSPHRAPHRQHSVTTPNTAPQRQTQPRSAKPSFHPSLLPSQRLPSHSAPSPLFPQSSIQITSPVPALKFNTVCMPSTSNAKQENGFSDRFCKSP